MKNAEISEKSVSPSDKRKTATSILKFKPEKRHHNTTFTCQAHNPALSLPYNANILILVKYPPSVQLTADKERIVEFDKVTLTCEAEGNPNDLIYKWYENGAVILGNWTKDFTIDSIKRDYNDVKISCEVTNAVGTNIGTITLDVTCEYKNSIKTDWKIALWPFLTFFNSITGVVVLMHGN